MSFGMAVAFMMFLKELRRNDGETAENRHLPPHFFLSFLAELDIFESFEAKKNSAILKLTAVTHFLAEFLR